MGNVERRLVAAGLTTESIVALRISTTDLSALGRAFKALGEHLAELTIRPEGTFVQVDRLSSAGAMVAIGVGPLRRRAPDGMGAADPDRPTRLLETLTEESKGTRP